VHTHVVIDAGGEPAQVGAEMARIERDIENGAETHILDVERAYLASPCKRPLCRSWTLNLTASSILMVQRHLSHHPVAYAVQ